MLAEIPKQQKLLVMLGVMLSMFLAALDQTIVATAMPRIVQELHGLEHLSWVFTAYLLSSTVVVPIYGKLSDIYGRKLFILIAVTIFLIGSMLSGFSQNMIQLIVFRAIQGIGGGAIFANSFAIIGDLFSPRERGRWQGLFGGVFGLASVVGPTLGGWLTDNVSWRWNFFVNIPVGVVAFAVVLFMMPKIASHAKSKSVDYVGAFLLSLGIISLLLGVVWGGNLYPWMSYQILSLFTVAVVSIGLFGVVEKKVAEPILPLELFKNSIFSLSMLILFIVGAGMFGAIVYIPLFAQLVLGTSATNSGTILTPLILGLVFASIVSGQVVSRTGRYKILATAGLVITSISMYVLSLMNAHTTQSDLLFRMIATGIGLGLTLPIFNLVVQNAFDHSKLGVVTASAQLFRSIGSTIGTALMGAVLNSSLNSKLTELSKEPFMQTISKAFPQFNIATIDINKIQGMLSPIGRNAIESQLQQLPLQVRPEVMQAFAQFGAAVKEGFATSVSQVFMLASGIVAVGFVASLFLKEIPLKKSHRPGLEEAGVELAVEEGDFPAKSEPKLY